MLTLTAFTGLGAGEDTAKNGAPLPLGSRRELLVDDHLIARMDGVTLKMHKPKAQDVVLVCDAPWEGNTSGYYTLFQDGDLFRCYYRGSHHGEADGKPSQPGVTCYAESRDGITWTKPKLGLFEFEGSKDNNIVHMGDGCSTFAPFLDTNPDCPPASRYKALATMGDNVERKKNPALQAYHSADGLRWKLIRNEPVITAGSFDSQNTAFYDTERGEYRAYWRYFTGGYTDERGWKPSGVRAIRTATSKDFLKWENQADLQYGDAPAAHLYTSALRPYARSPHLFLGFPTRYQPKHQQVEPVLMTSRDGVHFKRWPDPVIPITAPKDRDGNRANYMTLGVLSLPGRERGLSVYATEAYYTGPGSRIRRFTYRVDGFVSANVAAKGELLTKPLAFTGSKLSLNLTSKGATRVEVQDASDKALPGFALEDCAPIIGDHIDHTVVWKGGSLALLASQPVRLRFALQQADLFSLQFTP
ncbi:MAG: hypothetical protein HZA89_17880 [Verrucomicrobia bacterium]|nr:hypothetical protein [Verrucomicrobiota bacterium]